MATATKFDWQTCDEPAEMVQLLRGASERKKRLALDAYLLCFTDEQDAEYQDIHRYFDGRFSCDCSRCVPPERMRVRCDILREIFPPPPKESTCWRCRGTGKQERTFIDHFDSRRGQCTICQGSGILLESLTFDPTWRTPTVIGLAQRIDNCETNPCTTCFESGTVYPMRACPMCNGKGEVIAWGDPDFSAMPILADALEEAGCEDERILSHCRGIAICRQCEGYGFIPRLKNYPVICPDCHFTDAEKGCGFVKVKTPHLRGCWVIDLILERE